ncbi:NAD-dependent epimerase/dehydratase family protein [Neorhodopirellula lusitana]|uniref:NAD-dependent epimerase/dehydratase family protein n=1 Tax=Neorhodopirellula lusitana TaxID=445327 RepID=UPI00384D387E
MRVFLTGATGLLGNNILRQLSDQGHTVSCLTRGTPEPGVFEGTNAELVQGDLFDQPTLNTAIAQADAVIHCAGLIHIGWTQHEISMRINRDGTRLIAETCLKKNRKLVHVGTVNTLAISTRDTVSDETTPLDIAGGQVPCSYINSKRAGVEEVKKAVANGLQATIVHPAFMLGPWDWKPSSGRMMLEIGRAWRPIAPSGGNSVCDSRDVAAGTIAAITAPVQNGSEFILAGHNLRYKELWDMIAPRMGKRGPLFRAGPGQRWVGGATGDLWTKISGNEPDLNSASIGISSQTHSYDSSRAIKELGYRIRPLEETLDDAANWIKRQHMQA